MNNGPRKGGRLPPSSGCEGSLPSRRPTSFIATPKPVPRTYTDPGLIANSDPAGGQFIHVSVTPDGSKFHVQIGPDGPQREFASR